MEAIDRVAYRVLAEAAGSSFALVRAEDAAIDALKEISKQLDIMDKANDELNAEQDKELGILRAKVSSNLNDRKKILNEAIDICEYTFEKLLNLKTKNEAEFKMFMEYHKTDFKRAKKVMQVARAKIE